MYVFFFLPPVHSPNHATDSNARWLKRRGLSQGSALQASVFSKFSLLVGHFPQKPPKFRRQCGNLSQNENAQ